MNEQNMKEVSLTTAEFVLLPSLGAAIPSLEGFLSVMVLVVSYRSDTADYGESRLCSAAEC